MRISAVMLVITLAGAGPAVAQTATGQQTVRDVLAFLVTNQAVPTGDFVKDQQAAAATLDTLSHALLVSLATLPISSSSGGFVYRFNPALSTMQRASEGFGPFFLERAITAGSGRMSLTLTYQASSFDSLDGNDLRSGTFVTTANKFKDESAPFDVETLTLRIRTNTVTFAGNYGVTDRLDIGFAVPFVTLQLDGERVDVYRGTTFQQAKGSAFAAGLADTLVRVKYDLTANGGSGVSIGADTRLPTGNPDNLLGAGKIAVRGFGAASVERGPVAVHVNGGYLRGGISSEIAYGGAVDVAVGPRLTVDGEFLSRRLLDLNRMMQVVEPHPTIAGVDTLRLLPVGDVTVTTVVAGGVKWNLAEAWLLNANVVLPVGNGGLTARIMPTVALEWAVGK